MRLRRKDDLATKIERCLRAKELGKRAYTRADELLREIAKEIEPGQTVSLGENRKAVLKDKFADKDIVWTPCGARRWEIEVIET